MSQYPTSSTLDCSTSRGEELMRWFSGPPPHSPPLDGVQEVLILRYGVAAKLLAVHGEAVLPQPHHHLHLEPEGPAKKSPL